MRKPGVVVMPPPFRRGVCWEMDLHGARIKSWKIRLIQQGVDKFKVVYGLGVREGLTYSEAALELGACLMHHLACENRLDNRDKDEKDGLPPQCHKIPGPNCGERECEYGCDAAVARKTDTRRR